MTANEIISPSWKMLGFVWPSDLPAPKPGQFFTFKPSALSPGDSGLLRRPLAFAAFGEGRAYALYQIKGRGTAALASLAPGASIDLLGPLGNPFTLPKPGEPSVLIGGGIGIGPILFLHSRIREAGNAAGLSLFLGFRGAAQIPLVSESGMAESLASASLATDDGSVGFPGRVVDAVKAGLPPAPKAGRRYYACGPAPMLSAVASLAKMEANLAEVSVEQWMACGVGACYGCVVPSSSGGFLRACADGPVFDSRALDWEALG
jgi:dihydroorotate dehydrogenase electron transfer subunit